jgi:hypothetical protein
MIPTRRGRVRRRSVIRDPITQRVFLAAEFARLGLLVWKLGFHLTTNGHQLKPMNTNSIYSCTFVILTSHQSFRRLRKFLKRTIDPPNSPRDEPVQLADKKNDTKKLEVNCLCSKPNERKCPERRSGYPVCRGTKLADIQSTCHAESPEVNRVQRKQNSFST